MDTSIVNENTENDIKDNLNTRATELAKVPENKDMMNKAGDLLNEYLENTTVADAVDQNSMASIKKSLNLIMMELVHTSEKIGTEARRLFDEILTRTNIENIDPLIRMKTEAALYDVIVKELSAYGNTELVKKAVDILHEVAQQLPHDSTTNDMIMSHKARQLHYMK